MTANLTLLLLKNNLVLFDGVCNLCNSTVDFIISHDRKKVFYFCPLQSETGKNILEKMEYHAPALSSIVLIQNFKSYDQSDAILRILKTLGFPWALFFYLFILLPRGIRNLAYKYISANRYRFFGKKDTCRLPTAEEKARFIL